MKKLPEQIQEWVNVAENDLKSAYKLLFENDPVRDTACFHCQQAAEKILKAYLFKNKTHFENCVY